MRVHGLWFLVILAAVGACSLAGMPRPEPSPAATIPALPADEIGADPAPSDSEPAVATFGSGCFWCTEALFRQLKGVTSVSAGFSGGTVKNPTYEQVCGGDTGHAEAVQVHYDPAVVTYPELLQVFWQSHDSTTKNRQGADVGTQYRSAVFYHSERQHRLADLYKKKLDAAGVFSTPIVTEVEPFDAFYPADADHQNYFEANPRKLYCRVVIGPKVEKLREVFADKLKDEPK